MSVTDWSPQPSGNAMADPAIPARDGMAVRDVSRSVRGVMAGMRNYADSQGGALVTGGRFNAYTVDTALGVTELRPGLSLIVKVDRDNTAEATLNVDGSGPLPWVDAAGVRLIEGRILKGRFYNIILDADALAWRVQAGASTLDEIPGLTDLQTEIAANAAQVQAKTAEAIASAATVALQAGEVSAAQAQVATNTQAVSTAATQVAQDKTAAETARTTAQTASAQAQAAVGNNRIVKDTLADLSAALNYPDGTIGEVVKDPIPSTDTVGNGYYAKSGPSGSGSWVKKSKATVPALDSRAVSLEQKVQARARRKGWAATDERGNAILAALVTTTGATFRTAAGHLRRSNRHPGWAVTDEQGFGLIHVTKTAINHPVIRQLLADVATALAKVASVRSRLSGSGWAVVDEAGNALIRVTKSDIRHPAFTAVRARLTTAEAALVRFKANAVAPNWPSAIALAEQVQIVIYGQSLSVGALSQPPLTTAALPYADRFNGGVRTLDGGTDAAATHASLVGLFEQNDTTNMGETPASGAAQMFFQLLRDENGIDLGSVSQRLLLSTPGEGSRSAAYLSANAPRQRLTDDITYGKVRADALNRSHAVGALGFVQGEQDYALDTDPEAWKATVRALRQSVENTANTASGLSRTLPMFLCQTATHPTYSKTVPTIALAQLALCDEANFAFVTPKHFLPYIPANQHLTNVGSKWLGAYYGLALKRALIDGVKVKPLVPDETERNGNTALLRFSSAVGGLVFDTATLADPGNLGFTLVDASGTPMTITSVALVGVNEVAIKASAPIPAGARIRNAWVGNNVFGVGNLRDRQGDLIAFDPTGINRPMHRWAPIFERTL